MGERDSARFDTDATRGHTELTEDSRQRSHRLFLELDVLADVRDVGLVLDLLRLEVAREKHGAAIGHDDREFEPVGNGELRDDVRAGEDRDGLVGRQDERGETFLAQQVAELRSLRADVSCRMRHRLHAVSFALRLFAS